MRLVRTLAGGLAAALIASSSANAVVLYQNNFDGNEAHHSGVTGAFALFPTEAATAGAWNAQGWAGNYGAYRTGGIPSPFGGLYLSNLATHTTISASFLLGFLESWDSYDGSCCSPDHLEVWIDGAHVATLTSNNALGTIEDYDGGTELYDGEQLNNFHHASFDTLVDMSTAGFLTFAHTASTLSLEFRVNSAGWQGGGDEGFGLDNVVLTYDGVRTGAIPEPSTWALMICGFGAAGGMLRRRRLATA